jgi:curved DNA-binding protein CbpA
MIQDSNGESTKIGIELLLTHDISADTLNANAALGRADAGHLLERGLRILRSMPFQALGVSHDCTSAEVRKAFKKQALKYHPDKNPRTTPLFVTMKAVSDRLAETGERMRAADVAKRVPAAGPPPTGAASEPSAKYDSSKTASTSRDSNMSSSTSSSETAHGTKQSNANNAKANGQESNANANGSTHWFSHIYGRNTGGRERESRYSNGSCDSEKLPTRDSNANARQYSSQQNTPRYSDIRGE